MHSPGCAPGDIQSTHVMNDSLDPKRALKLALGSRRYELRIQSARADLFDAQVILTDGSRTQVLYAVGGFAGRAALRRHVGGRPGPGWQARSRGEPEPEVQRAPVRLLLSTKASGSQLVGEAAVFETGD